jgi:hypothetical protein
MRLRRDILPIGAVLACLLAVRSEEGVEAQPVEHAETFVALVEGVQLQKRIEELARESAKSLFLVDAFSATWGAAHGAPSLPNEDAFFNQHD